MLAGQRGVEDSVADFTLRLLSADNDLKEKDEEDDDEERHGRDSEV